MSIRYLPTRPDELAKPLGKWLLLELSRRRGGFAATGREDDNAGFDLEFLTSLRVHIGDTAGPSPSEPRRTSRTIAPVRTSRLPVFMAGKMWTPGELKFEFVPQARPH